MVALERRFGCAGIALVVAIGLMGAACAPSVAVSGAMAQASLPGETRVEAPGGAFMRVSPARLAALLQAKDFVLVNVHVPYDGEIEGTDAFIPYDQVGNRLAELPAARDAKILIYCRSGRMSTEAARTLVGLGYSSVLELDGGMVAWEAAGYRLVRDSRR